MNKVTIMLCALLLGISTVSGHGKFTDANITGHVIDKETKEHLAYATIKIKGTTIAITTDATGHYFIKNLPLGTQTITVAHLGYASTQAEVLIKQDHHLMEVNFELEPQSLMIDETVVTASRSESDRRTSSAVVGVMSSLAFEQTASASPAEMLNFQPGLRVESTCGNCAATELRINGLGGQYSQVLLDSRPIFSSLASVYGLEQIPSGMIERIEVIRGGGSALFGSNAIGGVVNIITKDPLRNTLAIANNTGVFGHGRLETNTSFNGSFVTDDHKAGVYLFGMVKDRDTYDRNGDGFSDIPKLSSETIGFRAYYRLTNYSRLTAEYHHIREFRRGGDSLSLPPHQANIAEQLRHNINGGGLKYDLSPGGSHNQNVSIYASVQKVSRDSYFGTGQNLNAYGRTKDLTFVGGGQYSYRFDRLWFMPAELVAGAEYTDNDLDDYIPVRQTQIKQHTYCYGAFFQNEWRNEKFGLLLGGRLDKHSKIDNVVFAPRVNVRYSPSSALGFRASYSSGYRAPQAYDEDLHVNAVQGALSIIQQSPDLKPEYSNSFSASVDLYHRFGKVQANLLVEGFYTHLKDVFVLEPNGVDSDGNLLWLRTNSAGAVVQGINAELRLGLTSKLNADAGFTIQSSRYKDALEWTQDENSTVVPGRKMFRSPGRYGYLTLNYIPMKKMSVSATGNYTGPMLVQHIAGYIPVDTERMTPNFFDAGVRVAYDFKLSGSVVLQVSAGMKNIFDQFQADIDRGEFKDASYIYGPAMPRMTYVGVKFTL